MNCVFLHAQHTAIKAVSQGPGGLALSGGSVSFPVIAASIQVFSKAWDAAKSFQAREPRDGHGGLVHKMLFCLWGAYDIFPFT